MEGFYTSLILNEKFKENDGKQKFKEKWKQLRKERGKLSRSKN
jgi:hypothetical protein